MQHNSIGYQRPQRRGGAITAGPRQPGAAACLECPVRRIGFCAKLTDADLSAMSIRARIRAEPADRSLAKAGHSVPNGILVAGILRNTCQRADGKRQITSLITAGELVETSRGGACEDIEAATDAVICHLHPASVSELLRTSHDYRRAVLAARQNYVERLREHSWTIRGTAPVKRIAAFLVGCRSILPSQPLPNGGTLLSMQLSRVDIAAYLDTTVETLCRAIGKLDAEGLIRTRSPHRFEIPDLNKLALFAGVEITSGGANPAEMTAVNATRGGKPFSGPASI